MKKLTTITLLCLICILSSCSQTTQLAPDDIYNKRIEFFVQKSLDTQSDRHKEKFLYLFRENNTYKVTNGAEAVHAGNFSYVAKNNTSSSIVCSYSENGKLSSYQIILNFETKTKGTWESSFNAETVGAEAGTFIILNEKEI